MNNDIKLNKWKISADSHCCTDDFLESVFFTGNGRMGSRGYLSFGQKDYPEKTGLFIAGIFGEIKKGITDFVNLPTPIYSRLQVNGFKDNKISSVRRTLDLHNGKFTADYILKCKNVSLKIKEERFFSLENTGLLVQKITLIPNEDSEIKLYSGVNTLCCNLPVPDDQTKKNKETVQLVSINQKNILNNGVSIQFITKGTELKINEEIVYHTENLLLDSNFSDDEGTGIVFKASAHSKSPLVIEQCAFISTSRDKDTRIKKINKNWNFDSLLHENDMAWSKHWETANIEICGDENSDAALRYVIFELIANNSSKDSTVSIGARGLTHTRYKGCYFWDTELFMMPFYLYTNPEAAKNLMQYRINTLPQAKLYAKKMNSDGARYPWMTSYDGSEQCESWDIGASELHITADIVYALNNYIKTTADKDFYVMGASQVYIETARFWMSRYTWEKGTNKVNLLFCKGPDEYCGITSNNLYTNVLVKENLQLAQEAANYLNENNKEKYRELRITQNEINDWKRLQDAIKLPKDPVTGHWRQDDTFHLLEEINLSDLKQGNEASYHCVCFDRLQRYKVIKQSDVILLMSRFPELFSDKEKEDAWNDFEPLCLHDSTLSFATHALFAAQNGFTEKAEQYFNKALFLDLRDLMNNTGKEGLHLAGLGESYQAVVLGFCGLSFENGKPKLNPHLPKRWKKVNFRFFYKSTLYEADIENSNVSIKAMQ